MGHWLNEWGHIKGELSPCWRWVGRHAGLFMILPLALSFHYLSESWHEGQLGTGQVDWGKLCPTLQVDFSGVARMLPGLGYSPTSPLQIQLWTVGGDSYWPFIAILSHVK